MMQSIFGDSLMALGLLGRDEHGYASTRGAHRSDGRRAFLGGERTAAGSLSDHGAAVGQMGPSSLHRALFRRPIDVNWITHRNGLGDDRLIEKLPM